MPEGTEIKLENNPEMYVDYSTNNRFQLREKKYKWPVASDKQGNNIDFSNIIITDSGGC